MTGAYLSPGEAARELGVTVKALKLYERRGLLAPHRTVSGWRAYGPEAIMRGKEILSLKALGLSLSRIGDILGGRQVDLAATLAAQEAVLRAQRDRLDASLKSLSGLRRRIVAGDTIPARDILASVGRVPSTVDPQDILRKHYSRRLGAETWAEMEQRGEAPWEGLVAELKSLAASNADPRGAVALDLMVRWREAGDAVTGGDPDLKARAYIAWLDALEDDEAASLPLGREETDFLLRMAAALNAVEASSAPATRPDAPDTAQRSSGR